jgi:chorismate mutase
MSSPPQKATFMKVLFARILSGAILTSAMLGAELVLADNPEWAMVSGGGDAHAAPASPLTPLVDDAAERLQTADPVAATKYLTQGAVDDPTREDEVIQSAIDDAAARNIDPEYVRSVFRDQIDATDSVEHSRFAQWKIDPGRAPTSAPDLASSRNSIDALNGSIVEKISTLWPVLHSPACLSDLHNAVANVSAARHLDDVLQHALVYAVHRYCG